MPEFKVPLEKKVYEILKSRGRLHADQIAAGCGVEIKRLFPALLQLEIRGVIREIRGKYYEALL